MYIDSIDLVEVLVFKRKLRSNNSTRYLLLICYSQIAKYRKYKFLITYRNLIQGCWIAICSSNLIHVQACWIPICSGVIIEWNNVNFASDIRFIKSFIHEHSQAADIDSSDPRLIVIYIMFCLFEKSDKQSIILCRFHVSMIDYIILLKHTTLGHFSSILMLYVCFCICFSTIWYCLYTEY